MFKGKKEIILLLEDDNDVRVTIRQVLEMAGYTVLSTANGSDGLKILHKILPDLIIVDMSMPIMDGEEFLRQKSKYENFAAIPVIMMSAYRDRLLNDHDCLKLSKPLDMDHFLKKIPEMLYQKTVAV